MRRARAAFAFVVVLQLVFAAYAAWVYWPRAEAEATGTYIVAQQTDGEAQRQVQGTVWLRLEPPGSATWRVERSDGVRHELGHAPAAGIAWDTSQVENGAYTVVAQTQGQVVGTRQLEVQNARSDAATAAAVVGTATVVATGASSLSSSVASRIGVAAIQVGKETALALGEDHLRLRSAGRRRHMPSALALALALVMVFLFFALEGLPRLAWDAYLAALPVAGGVSAVFVAMALGAEALLAFAGRAASRVRFLASGAVSLVVSSIAFRTPFGYPGYVAEQDDADADGQADQPAELEAARAAASLLVLLGLLLPMLWLGARFHAGIAEQATEIALVAFATGAMPIKPMPGYDIWRWRRLPAVALAVTAYWLFFGFQLALLDAWWLMAAGWVGLGAYAVTFAWLRARTAVATPVWYVAWRAAWQQVAAGVVAMSPRSALHAARRLGDWAGQVAALLDRSVDAAVRASQAAWAPLARVLAAREQARQAAAVAEARRRFIADALAFVRGMERVPDDTVISTPRAHVRLGDVRADLQREQAAAKQMQDMRRGRMPER